MGKIGVRSGGPAGSIVAGLSGGTGSPGRSGSRFTQLVGISDSGSVYLTVSSLISLLSLYGSRGLRDLRVGGGGVPAAEDGRAGHEERGPRLGALRGRVRIDAAVDLDRRRIGQQLAQPAHLGGRALDVRLAAPAGVHGHAEQVVEGVRDRRHRLGRG